MAGFHQQLPLDLRIFAELASGMPFANSLGLFGGVNMKRAIVVALLLAGCGSSEPSSTSVTGTAETDAFTAPNALYNEDSDGNVAVLLSNDVNACDRVSNGLLVTDAGATEGALLLLTKDEHFWNNDVRTVNDDLQALLSTPRLPDGGCVQDADGGGCLVFQATSGKMHLARADDDLSKGIADGDFDLTFPDGNHLTGTFRATPCSNLTGCPSGTSAFCLPLLGLGLRRRKRRA